MKVTTPEIAWHARDPIYSIDFQYVRDDIQRLATCGTDRHVRIWELTYEKPSGKANVEFRSSLTRHTKSVNVVRFSPCGMYDYSIDFHCTSTMFSANPKKFYHDMIIKYS